MFLPQHIISYRALRNGVAFEGRTLLLVACVAFVVTTGFAVDCVALAVVVVVAAFVEIVVVVSCAEVVVVDCVVVVVSVCDELSVLLSEELSELLSDEFSLCDELSAADELSKEDELSDTDAFSVVLLSSVCEDASPQAVSTAEHIITAAISAAILFLMFFTLII